MLRRWRLDLECLGSWAAPESLEIFTSPASVAYPREPRGHERFFLLRRRRPGGFERFRWGRGQVGFSGGQQMNQRYTTGGQKESEDPSRLSRRHRRHLRRRPWMAVDRSLLPVSCHVLRRRIRFSIYRHMTAVIGPLTIHLGRVESIVEADRARQAASDVPRSHPRLIVKIFIISTYMSSQNHRSDHMIFTISHIKGKYHQLRSVA
jgi:hypothetical protein